MATKSPVAREALYRIRRLYDREATWRDKPPDEIARLRNHWSRPELEAFFAWAVVEYEAVRGQRGWLRTAFGYALRQKEALMRFLDDGRLNIDNTASERELRQIAVGRKAWLFVGSDDHASSAASLLSLIASARLHRLDPDAYVATRTSGVTLARLRSKPGLRTLRSVAAGRVFVVDAAAARADTTAYALLHSLAHALHPAVI